MPGSLAASSPAEWHVKCRWCPAGTYLVVTSGNQPLLRYSTFHGTELVATFTLYGYCELLKVSAGAEAMFFETMDKHDRPGRLLVTDRSGAQVAEHAVPGLAGAVHLSMAGLLVLSPDQTVLAVCSAAGALHTIGLRDRPRPRDFAECSSWQDMGVVVSGPSSAAVLDTIGTQQPEAKCEVQFIDLLASQVRGRRVVLGRQCMQAEASGVQMPDLGRRSLALLRYNLPEEVIFVSASHGSVLFRLSGQPAGWDALGIYFAVIAPPNAARPCPGDMVSVHHGLSGACVASWGMQPIPRHVDSVLSLRWLTGTAALMCQPCRESAVHDVTEPTWLRLSFGSHSDNGAV